MTGKAISKIAVDSARAEADDLIRALVSPKSTQTYVSEFCKKFTLAPRVTVLEQAVDLAATADIEVNKDSMEVCIQQNVANQKTVGLDKLILELAKLCSAVRIERGRGWAIGLALIEMSAAGNDSVYDHVCVLIGDKIRGQEGLVAESLIQISRTDFAEVAMRLWVSLVRPALGDLARPYALSERETSEVIGTLGELPVESCPVSLAYLLPLLLDHADAKQRENFLRGRIGQLFQKNVLGSSSSRKAAGKSSEQSLLDAEQRDLLRQIEETFVASHRKAERLAHESEAERLRSTAEWRDRLRESESEIGRLRSRLEKCEVEISRLEEENDSCRDQLKNKENEIGRHASEIRQITREKEHGQTDQEERHLQKLQSRLVEPAAKLRDLIVNYCSRVEDQSGEMRALAVAFDALHRRLLKVAQTEDKRIPQEILAGTKSKKQ